MGEAVDLNAAAADDPRSSEPPLGPPSRHEGRRAADGVVRLRCEGRRGLHTGFLRDLSRGGMFLRLLDPEPAGRCLAFELSLPGQRFPARGIGEVVWQRQDYEGPGRPMGMALRFVALEARAIAMLAEILPGGEGPAVEILAPPSPRLWRAEAVAGEPPPADASAENAAMLEGTGWAPGGVSEPAEDRAAAEPEAAGASASALVASEGVGLGAVSAPRDELGSAPGIAVASPLLLVPGDAPWAPSDEVPRLPSEHGSEDAVDEALSEPMIFVPPPPLPPPPVMPEGEAEDEQAGTAPRAGSALRWGSTAAGIAAVAALATLVVVGAARHDVGMPAPAPTVARPVAPNAPSGSPPASLTTRGEASPFRRTSRREEAPAPVASPARAADATDGAPVEIAAIRPMAPPADRPATRVTGVRWETLPGGGTRVLVNFDGALGADRWLLSRIGGDTPRLVVRLLGVAAGGAGSPWAPASAEVSRIRAGYHAGDGVAELHLVLDLAGPSVRIADSASTGAELRLDLVPGT